MSKKKKEGRSLRTRLSRKTDDPFLENLRPLARVRSGGPRTPSLTRPRRRRPDEREFGRPRLSSARPKVRRGAARRFRY